MIRVPEGEESEDENKDTKKKKKIILEKCQIWSKPTITDLINPNRTNC